MRWGVVGDPLFKVFDLRGVDAAEALAMRTALAQAGIDFYETEKPNWFAGAPAIWVRHEDEVTKAREALVIAQAQWLARASPERTPGDHTIDWAIVRFLTLLAVILSAAFWALVLKL